MSVRTHADEGFSLIEIVIAMFLLGLIAIAILPALVSGIRYSAEQSAVATATRHINALIEQGRQNPSCTSLQALAGYDASPVDGTGHPYQTQGVRGVCPAAGGAAVSLEIWATQSGRELARVTALIYIPTVA